MTESELDIRRGKKDALRQQGIDPYPARCARAANAATLKAGFRDDADPQPETAAVGRLRALRGHGKMCFATIEDESASIQVCFKKDVLAERFELLKQIDLGDFLGVEGPLFRTKTGEITVMVKKLDILCKTLEPLPSKWHGLADHEIRFRRRYLDLLANPEVKAIFKKRAQIVTFIRRALTDRGFMEVETPMMQPLAGGAAARPFVTHHNALGIDLYMRIAPELYLKRLVVGGFEKVFEMNRNFRNEGMDRKHNPEFTMLEIYEAYADYEDMMNLTEELLHGAAQAVNGGEELPASGEGSPALTLKRPWRRVSFFDSIAQGGGPNLRPGDVEAARAAVAQHHIETPTQEYGDLLNALFDRFAEPKLIEPTFVTDYPTVISPLAKRRADEPELTERFELFIDGMEIANAFSELNDADDQEKRLRDQAAAKKDATVDEDFVSALRIGLPPTGGLGIGIDRVVMLLTGCRTIRDVILFPAMRPEEQVHGS